jgi:hypothetical protein
MSTPSIFASIMETARSGASTSSIGAAGGGANTSNNGGASGFSIMYNGCQFTFKSKFYEKGLSMHYVLLESLNMEYDKTGINKISAHRRLVFSRSRSECGMWRLTIVKPGDIGKNLYIQKGLHYTMSAFVVLELQIFLNSIFDNLPIGSFDEMMDVCQKNIQTIKFTLNNRDRLVEFGDLTTYTFDNKTVRRLAPYFYEEKYTNYKPVEDAKFGEYVKMTIQEQYRSWPSNSATTISDDTRIDFGKTNIKINGAIYEAEIERHGVSVILYYLIYSCEITTPDMIRRYQQQSTEENPNPRYVFDKKIKVKDFIVPIYAIPKIMPELRQFDKVTGEPLLPGFRQYDITGYGLYNFFSVFEYGSSRFDFSKILEYIQRCQNYKSSYLPSCTTAYKFTGSFYNNIDLFIDIKKTTLRLQKYTAQIKTKAKTRKHAGGKRQGTSRQGTSKQGTSRQGTTKQGTKRNKK